MKIFSLTVVALFLLVVFASPVSASAAAKAGLKHGNFFYFFDKAFEKADLFFTFSSEKKADKALEYADERLAEAEESANENNPEAVAAAMENYQENVSLAKREAGAVKDEAKTENLLSIIASNISNHQKVLEKVLEKVPKEAKEAIQKAIEVSKKEEGEEKATKQESEKNNELEKNKDEKTKKGDVGDNKKNEQKKEAKKNKEKQGISQLALKKPSLSTQNPQEQEKPKLEMVNSNLNNDLTQTEELAKKLAEEKLKKDKDEAKIKAEQEQLRESQRLADQQVAKEKQKEIERQQQLENQRLMEEKAKATTSPIRDIISPVISQIRAQKSADAKNYSIEWSTNEPTLGKVGVGGIIKCSISGCEDSYSGLGEFEQNESYKLDHQIIIDRDLEPATKYKYYIYATDKAGNETSFFGGEVVTELPIPLPELKGQYNIDIVLTKDKSPYFITGDVFINKKLQIEPGVKIKFNGAYKLVVNKTFGEIRVNGTKNEPVLFEFDQSFTDSNNGIYIRSNNDNVIDNAVTENASCGVCIGSEVNGIRANATISNSIIKNNIAGVSINNSNVKITSSVISKNRTGVGGVFNSRIEIFQSDISENSFIALSFGTGSIPQLKLNNIYGNNDIMRIHAHPDLAIAILSQNNISLERNKGYVYFGSESTSFWNNATGKINAQNNWWGTTDISVIANRIKEYHETSFDYEQVATSEFAGAGVQ